MFEGCSVIYISAGAVLWVQQRQSLWPFCKHPLTVNLRGPKAELHRLLVCSACWTLTKRQSKKKNVTRPIVSEQLWSLRSSLPRQTRPQSHVHSSKPNAYTVIIFHCGIWWAWVMLKWFLINPRAKPGRTLKRDDTCPASDQPVWASVFRTSIVDACNAYVQLQKKKTISTLDLQTRRGLSISMRFRRVCCYHTVREFFQCSGQRSPISAVASNRGQILFVHPACTD